MNFLRKFGCKIILLAFLVLMPVSTFAQTPSDTVDFNPAAPSSTTTVDFNPASSEGKIVNPLGQNGPKDIPTFIKTLLQGMLKIGFPIIALAIIYSGFLFVAARGNTEKLTKAKDSLLYTLIGAAILLGSWAIAMLISETVLKLY